MPKDAPGERLVDRLSAVLLAFEEQDRGVPIAELARRTGLPRSTTHRLVGQLVDIGWLTRDKSRFQLGIALFELGQLVPQQRRLRALVIPFLVDLREATKHTTNVAIIDGTDIVDIDRLPGPKSPPLPFRPGARHPAFATGMGKAIMAHLSRNEVDGMFNDSMPPLTPSTIRSRNALEQEFALIRSTGLAYDHEESITGVVAVASPFFGWKGEVAGAISVNGWRGISDIAKYGPAVRNAALNLTRSMRAARLS